jgi:hypothetical protein
MAAITNPGTNVTEFSGEYKALSLNGLSVATASDALTLSFVDNGIAEIQNVVGSISGGLSATFSFIQTSFSGLVVTVASFKEDGTAATGWGDATVNLLIVGK